MKLIIRFLHYLIYIVEKIEYRNIDLDENDISKKIIYSQKINDLQVSSDTDTGFVDVSDIHITQPYTHYKIVLDNGYELTCADNHILFTSDYTEIFVKDIKANTYIHTDKGLVKVKIGPENAMVSGNFSSDFTTFSKSDTCKFINFSYIFINRF